MSKWSLRFYLLFAWGGVLFAAVLLCITVFKLIPSANREKAFQKERIEMLEKRLEATEHKIAVKHKFLDQISKNPAFLERVAREKLNYVKPDEIIVRLEE